MSQENVELAREAYDALGLAARKRDFDAFFREYVHPEIEWVPLEGAPDAATAHGHGPVKARMMAMLDVMERLRSKLRRSSTLGSRSLSQSAFRDAGEAAGSTWRRTGFTS